MADKILIVDDDLDSLKLIRLMLQRHGYEVVAANAGTQALAKALSERPSLIILDVMMPDMDGYEVCRRLRANPETKAIPIIMFTAKTLVDDKVAGFEAGADDYVTKPTHPTELATRVKNVLSRTASTQPKKHEVSRGTTIGVIGAKGGVGTTTVAVNLAAVHIAKGRNAVVADFRLGAGSLGLMLGFRQPTGMGNVLSKPANDVRPSAIDGEMVAHQSGLRALLSSPRPKEAQLNYPPESASAVIAHLRTIGNPVVIDLGSGLNVTSSRLQKEMDQLVLVVEPNPVAIALAREILQEINPGGPTDSRVHVVVVNRLQTSVQTPWHEVEHTLGYELRAIISGAHEQLFQAMREGTPMVLSQPAAPISTQLVKLADDLNARVKVMAGGEARP
jgi:pilus assembly protein CpaE